MKSNFEIKCSILLPVYNEKNTILRNIKSLNEQVHSQLKGSTYEILLIDNGSTDGTCKVVPEFLSHIPEIIFLQASKKGRGTALNYGYSMARGKYICIMSIDRSWDENFISQAIKILESGVDIVYGPKSHPNSKVSRPFYRTFASLITRFILYVLFHIKPQDTQCIKAFKAYKIPFLSTLNSYNYFAETEFFLLASKFGLLSKKIPVKVTDKRKNSKTKMNSLFEFISEALHFKRTVWNKLSSHPCIAPRS